MEHSAKSAVVIGAGPNGLTAAIQLARAGYRVTVHEANAQIGGGARSEALTLPGYLHDTCSAIHCMAVASPCFEQFPLKEHGLEWIQPEIPLAHPLDDGTAAVLHRSLDRTASELGPDGEAWRRLIEPFIDPWPRLRHDLLGPIVRLPEHPLRMARFGMHALRPARSLAESRFRGVHAKALFAGLAAHSIMPLDAVATSAVGLVLGIVGHIAGWPLPRGGSQSISDALAGYLRAMGGEIVTSSRVTELPAAELVMCDITPRQLVAIAGERMPEAYRRRLGRFRYGPGVFKMDWALDGPIPWRAAACARAGTVHLGGTLEEIAQWEAHHDGRPFVLLAQPSLFDPTRAPAGKHTAWAYCHVPNGSTEDMTEEVEAQVERFAPGFRGRILARHVMFPADLERRNANLVGGDIAGGEMSLRQLMFRPTGMMYETPMRGVYLCSSSTPPGGGVHGMCGWWAVRRALASRR